MTSSAEDRLTISELVRSPQLRSYLKNLRDWHGYIRFLGLPDRRDSPDVLIDRLFVEPLVARRYVSPDEDPSGWSEEAETIFDVLRHGNPLIVLGDPGAGKSTLLKYLVWLLARPKVGAWSKRMGGWLLPVPMVLRELQLDGVNTFGGLVGAFLDHAVGKPLREGEYLRHMLEDGRVLILLDGIDEIGGRSGRGDLRAAVFDGFARYPNCQWVLSSRIVGYDEVPFDGEQQTARQESGERGRVRRSLGERVRTGAGALPFGDEHGARRLAQRGMERGSGVIRRYIAPFDDGRIEAFAQNWYVQREAAARRAGEDAIHLVRAVHADEAILRLARVPNLLTMMALIHRVEATLPHGRALLYGRIAEAYLESIDKFRGVYSGAYNLQQKKRWLARVAYEMQRRRTKRVSQAGGKGRDELLAEADDVIGWLREEMNQGSIAGDMSAEEFLDYVGRRSGLFLPRGEQRYAFVHLSFQEYFAAVALEREVTGRKWATGEGTFLGVTRMAVAAWASESTWREPFAFLFELLADREDWHADLLDAVFGKGFSRVTKSASDADLNLARLLARLVANQRSGLPRELVHGATVAAIRPVLRRQTEEKYPHGPTDVFAELFGDDADRTASVMAEVGAQMREMKSEVLSLARTQVADLRPMKGFVGLKYLYLGGTQISDLTPLTELKELAVLDIAETKVADLGPLSGLSRLALLYLEDTAVSDLRPLANLTRLRCLNVRGTRILDLGPLAAATGLTDLDCSGTDVTDLGPLGSLRTLEHLVLWGTRVSDIGVIAGLVGLKSLDLWGTRVVDFGPLERLTALTTLDCGQTEIADLSVLGSQTALVSLVLRNTAVTDFTTVAKLRSLRRLDLSGTGIEDVAPVACVTTLESLNLSGTEVSDVGSLGGLGGLRSLFLLRTNVSQAMVTKLREALPDCKIVY